MEHYVQVNNINLHYLEYADNGSPILLMHGLTANAAAFGGLVAAGLDRQHHLYSIDLRGRGLSDHPAFCYSVQEHAEDILGLLDHLKLDRITLCGHSFGGYLSFYLAANYPTRVDKVIILDAAVKMNPRAGEMLAHRVASLDQIFPSWDEYIAAVKTAPYNTFWDDAMLSYYQADVKEVAGGGVTPRSNLTNIIEASMGLANIPWAELISSIQAPVLLVNAPDNYNLDEPLLPDDYAEATVALLPHGRYVRVDGNHQTMLYGEGAKETVAAIEKFMAN